MDKHERELDALRAVYLELEFESVIHRDRPDFLLSRGAPTPPFGVEITDIYPTESDARIMHRVGYIERLFKGGAHIHKDDVHVLKVVRVQITDKDGNIKASDVPAIFREVREGADHYAQIADAIRVKTVKATEYAEDIDHLNLIVVDHYPVYQARSQPYFTRTLLGHGIRSALAASPFHEVFLVSRDDNGFRYYRPLVLILLLEQFKLFVHALDSFTEEIPIALKDVAGLFVLAMRGSNLGDVYYSEDHGNPMAVYRSAAVRISDEGEMVVLDLHDLPGPHQFAPPELQLDAAMWQRIIEYHRTFASGSGIEVAVAIPEANPSRNGAEDPRDVD